MFEVLEDSSEIHSKIKWLFSEETSNLRRVILVAFVGARADQLLPDVKGVQIYCWPQIGATHPLGLEKLEDRGAVIYLADNLHTKLYWVEGRGAVITSANLSDNALKYGRQHEMGVYLEDSGAVNIEDIIDELEELGYDPLTSQELDRLKSKHKEHLANRENTIRKGKSDKREYTYANEEKEDGFKLGHANELVNMRALQFGHQICVCQTGELYDEGSLIFLYKFRKRDSELYEISRNAEQFDYHHNSHITKYAAEVAKYLQVPGRNRKFWKELYREGEFDLWDIEEGPMKFFEGVNPENMYLMILKVYEMPFVVEDKDFKRRRRGIGRMKNEKILKRMQDAFRNKEFDPVLDEHVFETRKQKIIEIAEKHI
jgi:hypothetical protein